MGALSAGGLISVGHEDATCTQPAVNAKTRAAVYHEACKRDSRPLKELIEVTAEVYVNIL